MEIELRKREVYGRVTWYPENDAAKALAAIAGTKTLTEDVLNIAMRMLGATVHVTHELAPGVAA